MRAYIVKIAGGHGNKLCSRDPRNKGTTPGPKDFIFRRDLLMCPGPTVAGVGENVHGESCTNKY